MAPELYHAKHQPQLGRGVPVPGGAQGSRDCGPRTIQMGLDQLTRGQLIPSIAEIRKRMHKQGPVPTSTADGERCVESYGGEMARFDRRRLTYDRFTGEMFRPLLVDAIKAGEYVQVAIDYGVFNREMRKRGLRTGDPNFDGGHSIGLQGWQPQRGNDDPDALLFDPLDDKRRAGIPDGPRWVPLAAVLPAWKAMGSFFGVLRGGERTL